MYILYFSYQDGSHEDLFFEEEFDAHVYGIQKLEWVWDENWEPGNCQLFIPDGLTHKEVLGKTLDYLVECRDKGIMYPRYFRIDRWGAPNIVFVRKAEGRPKDCMNKTFQELLNASS